MPKTKLGLWSVWLGLAMLVLIFLGPILDTTYYETIAAGNNLFDDLTVRPLLAVPVLLGIASGLAAFVTGLLAITKLQDRSWFVYLSTTLGALLIVFMIGDAFSAE